MDIYGQNHPVVNSRLFKHGCLVLRYAIVKEWQGKECVRLVGHDAFVLGATCRDPMHASMTVSDALWGRLLSYCHVSCLTLNILR